MCFVVDLLFLVFVCVAVMYCCCLLLLCVFYVFVMLLCSMPHAAILAFCTADFPHPDFRQWTSLLRPPSEVRA